MKFIYPFLLSICLLVSCSGTRIKNEPVNQQIASYIRQSCEADKPCKIELKNATNFSWDKLYVFDEGVEDTDISKALQINYSSTSPYLSRKWFFVKDGKVVQKEEHILYEVDVTVNDGDVLLREDTPNQKFSIFGEDAIFKVSKNALDNRGYYYYLTYIKD